MGWVFFQIFENQAPNSRSAEAERSTEESTQNMAPAWHPLVNLTADLICSKLYSHL